MRNTSQSGFALIALMIVLVIIAIMFVIMNRGSLSTAPTQSTSTPGAVTPVNADQNTINIGQKAKLQLNQSNKQLQDYQKQLQAQ